MRVKLICCEVLTREACAAIAASPLTVDPVFTPKSAHTEPEKLRRRLQQLIDETDPDIYDRILLGYGICGNSTLNLKARSIPLIIPRAHDCCTLFLGSRSRFTEEFGARLSAGWTSDGYMERGYELFRDDGEDTTGFLQEYAALVEKYGEDNAQYIWETMHPEVSRELIYITSKERPNAANMERMRSEAEEKDLPLCIIEGTDRLLRMLVCGEYTDEEFLTVQPGQHIAAVYDNKIVMKAEND